MTPQSLLDQAASKYAAIKTFRAERIERSTIRHETPALAMVYQAPNKWRFETYDGLHTNFDVCDGKTSVCYGKGRSTNIYVASASLGARPPELGTGPWGVAAWFYPLFGGPGAGEHIARLAKRGVIERPDVTVDGVSCKVVLIGKPDDAYTEYAIGSSDGLVHRIVARYLPPSISQSGMSGEGTKFATDTTVFRKIVADGPVDAKEFETTLPDWVQKPVPRRQENPPGTVGSPLRDFTVADLITDAKVGTASLRGKFLLIFTFNGLAVDDQPMLKQAMELNATYGPKGLVVMPVGYGSQEDVLHCAAMAHFNLPCYVNKDRSMDLSVRFDDKCRWVVVNGSGSIVAHLGLCPVSKMGKALERAGLSR